MLGAMNWAAIGILGVLGAAGFVLSPAGTASAQDTDERARTHFQSGTAYFDAGNYESGLREFQEAYDLSGRPGLLYNLYLCEERLGHLPEAATHLERYLAEVEDLGERRGVLEQRLENIRRRAAEEQREADERAAVAAAAAAAGTGVAVGVAAGTEGDPATTTGTEADPAATPEDAPSDVPEPDQADDVEEPGEADDPAPGEASSGGLMPTSVAVTYAVAGAGAVSWAVFGILAASENGRLNDECASGCNSSDVTTLRTYNIIADIGFAVTVAGAALATFLWLLLPGDSGEHASVAPYMTPEGAGLFAQGSL